MKSYKEAIESIMKDTTSKVMDHAINAYRQGYEDGQKEKPQAIYEMKLEEYNKGLNDAWECAKNMVHMTPDERVIVFDISNNSYGNQHEVFTELSASEAIEKMKLYEEIEKSCKTCVHKTEIQEDFHKYCMHCVDYSKYKSNQTDDIKVGDEVIIQDNVAGVVTGFDILYDGVYVIASDGWSDRYGKSFIKKTGRHFDEIENVLKYMNMKDE